MIKVIAIDDEPLALLQLEKMIEITPYMTLVAGCSDAFEAMKVIEENEVDAIFADINMPDLSGLDFVKSLSNPPIVVFTTAYSQYAIDGYKVNAVDYLLKPFGMPEFQQAAAKVKKQYELINQSADEESRREGNILFIKVDYRTVRISISDIRYIESQSEYLKLFMVDGNNYMILMSIKRMMEILPKDTFIRIHRSFIVNMSHVIEFARLRMKMDANTYLPVGESYKEETLQFINERTVK